MRRDDFSRYLDDLPDARPVRVLLGSFAVDVVDVGWDESLQATVISLDQDGKTQASRAVFRTDGAYDPNSTLGNHPGSGGAF